VLNVVGSRFSEMGNSQGMHLGKGKGLKGNVDKGKINVVKSWESGQKEKGGREEGKGGSEEGEVD